MGHEVPGRLDLTYKPPLLDLEQWLRFCAAYTNHTGNKYHHGEKLTAGLAKMDGLNIAGKQWAAWLHWVAVYKLTGDGRGSFTTEES